MSLMSVKSGTVVYFFILGADFIFLFIYLFIFAWEGQGLDSVSLYILWVFEHDFSYRIDHMKYKWFHRDWWLDCD